jgi:hypothetical protein
MTQPAVRRPRVQFEARGHIETHGQQHPQFGVWHSTESHDAAGTRDLEGIVNFWKGQGEGLGAHIIIDKDGNSAFCANPTRTTWAVAHHNTGGVHIELVGFAKFAPKAWFLRRKQLDKLARWMAWLNLEYGIPLRLSVNHGWSRHMDQSKAYGGDHWDPGHSFPRQYVLQKAQGYRAEGWE